MIPVSEQIPEQQVPQRPPTSGPGSGVTAWREYAAAVTESPLESWAAMSREDIIALLDSEGTEAEGAEPPADGAGDQSDELDGPTQSEREADQQPPDTRAEPAAPRRQRPVWMVPTADGMVPEHELRGR